MAASPKEIESGLAKQAARIDELKAQAAVLQAESGELRAAAKKAEGLEAKLEAAQAQAKEDAKRAQNAELRANQLTADLASVNAKNARLAGILQHVQERESAAKEVEKLLKGVA